MKPCTCHSSVSGPGRQCNPSALGEGWYCVEDADRDFSARIRFVRPTEANAEKPGGLAEFDRVVALIEAAENLSREDFDAAQVKACPDVKYSYLDRIWVRWRRGGLLWLACRSDEAEKRAVFEAVLRQAEAGS